MGLDEIQLTLLARLGRFSMTSPVWNSRGRRIYNRCGLVNVMVWDTNLTNLSVER